MALKDKLDTELMPTRKVIVSAIVALAMGLISAGVGALVQATPALAFLAFLNDPALAGPLAMVLMVVAAYFTKDLKVGWEVGDLDFADGSDAESGVLPDARLKSSMLASFLAVGLCAVLLIGCSSTPEGKWAQGQDGYNKLGQIIFDYRAPCVQGLPLEDGGVLNAGPDHPRCYIDDAAMLKIDVVLGTADAVLREMEFVSASGEGGPNYERLTARLDLLMVQIIAFIASAEAKRDAGG